MDPSLQRNEMSVEVKSDLYKAAGVDIDLATELLTQVKRKFAQTRRPEMLAPVGGFGGLFQIDLSRYKEPVMVSSIDGVGTKLMIAMMMEKYDTVGHDIVNHCIDDIAVQGAEPVYFMDYIGIGKLRTSHNNHIRLILFQNFLRQLRCVDTSNRNTQHSGFPTDSGTVIHIKALWYINRRYLVFQPRCYHITTRDIQYIYSGLFCQPAKRNDILYGQAILQIIILCI